MKTKIYEIPDSLVGEWEPDARAVIDTWTNQFITLDNFRETIFLKGIEYAQAHKGIAWIVDSSRAKSVFSKDIQDFIASDVFPMFYKIGIRYFLTISPEDTIAKLTVNKYSAKTGPAGLNLVKCSSTADAIQWVKEHALEQVKEKKS